MAALHNACPWGEPSQLLTNPVLMPLTGSESGEHRPRQHTAEPPLPALQMPCATTTSRTWPARATGIAQAVQAIHMSKDLAVAAPPTDMQDAVPTHR